jgi:hypothetical protein
MNYIKEGHKATNAIARPTVGLTVLILIGFIQRLIGMNFQN